MSKFVCLTPEENDLYMKIEYLKGKLKVIGSSYGLNHPLTLILSQKLDSLIFEYQNLRT